MNKDVIKIKKIETGTLWLLVIAIICIIAIIVFPLVYIAQKNTDFQKTDSEDEYLNRNYVSYNGGKEAERFFENFVKLDSFNNISFKYRDNDAKFTLRSASHTVFALDVEYKAEDYLSHKYNIWENTNMPDENNSKNYYGSFLITSVMLDGGTYTDNYCCIGFDDEHCIIRYLFFYNTNRKEALKHGIDSIKGIIYSSVMLDWYE